METTKMSELDNLEAYYKQIAQRLYNEGFRLKRLPKEKTYFVLYKDGKELGSGLLRNQQNLSELWELLGMPLDFNNAEEDLKNKQPILDALIALSENNSDI